MSTPPSELDRLRAELDRLDQDLLAAAARRTDLVRRIGEAKRATDDERPIFDRERERMVYARTDRIAREVGLDPQVAARLIEVLVERSHEEQERLVQAQTFEPTEVQSILILGGHGGIGRCLSRELTARGHRVDPYDVNDPRDRDALVAAADVVIVSVPMALAAEVTEAVAPHVRTDALLCDVNSLKEEVCAVMSRTGSSEALGLHPMFGPTVASLRRQKVVVCPVRTGPRAAWLRRELGRMGADLVETDPATHDRMMAVVQVLVHFSTLTMGEALRRSGVSIEESLRFTSPIYRLELAFIGRLFAQSADLYAEIEMANPRGVEVRRAFLEAARSMADTVDSGDRQGFRAGFQNVSAYFESFADEALTLSDHIIESLVRRP
jgi:chorismate mutase/prephenate dehydrogenase